MPLNCGAGKDFYNSFGQRRDQASQSWRKSTLNIHWKDWCGSWSSNTLATWCEELTHWKRPWCWERLRAGEGDNRGWDGWMVSSTQWTWIWANSGRQWRTGKPGLLQDMTLQLNQEQTIPSVNNIFTENVVFGKKQLIFFFIYKVQWWEWERNM